MFFMWYFREYFPLSLRGLRDGCMQVLIIIGPTPALIIERLQVSCGEMVSYLTMVQTSEFCKVFRVGWWWLTQGSGTVNLVCPATQTSVFSNTSCVFIRVLWRRYGDEVHCSSWGTFVTCGIVVMCPLTYCFHNLFTGNQVRNSRDAKSTSNHIESPVRYVRQYLRWITKLLSDWKISV